MPKTMSDTEHDNAGVIAPPPLIYLGPLLLGLFLHRARPIAFLPRPIARVLGWPLLACGIGGSLWFVVTMVRAHTPLDPRQPVRRVVTWGPFRLSRNPGYTSLAMIYVGVASVVNTLWPLLFLPAVFGVIRRQVIEREERYLDRKFGAEYRQYKASVRRWI
jgi:protein-S-isoprenylcysteine O-methyltransferase Ste14